MRWLLRLYPRGWRERYGEEMVVMLEAEPRTIRLVFDLVAGAVDARLNPQWAPRLDAARREGSLTMTHTFAHCRSVAVTNAEYLRSAVLTLGATMVLALAHVVLRRMTGENLLVEAYGVSVFPVAVLIGSWNTYLKPYSTAARIVLVTATGAVVFGLSLLASYVARVA